MLSVCYIIVSYYNLLVPTKAHIILMYITLCGCYMFRLVAIFRKLTTIQLKPHSNKLFLTILCM